ncbi:L domain-like protein [Piromyces finnis]|uniref:L domain-like protein n=1 Tax=Piromyces finnis TaxID=1754191 RepID=A0A1Y1UXQ4_9FUNG|nr:L domain-like protein [Piromyces finnis]|eukprot:ORX42472.1 L domain-like protein [Piromyces finnis]
MHYLIKTDKKKNQNKSIINLNLQFGDEKEHYNNDETVEDKLGIVIKKKNRKKGVTFKMKCDEDKKYMEISHLLDGYFMLNCSDKDSPENVFSLHIEDRNLEYVMEQDTVLFTNVEVIHAAENKLQMHYFKNFPKLKTLNLQCNGITRLESIEIIYNFHNLQYLDLSFNRISSSSLIVLSLLPNLVYLNIGYNELNVLPMNSDPDLSLIIQKIMDNYGKVGTEIAKQDLKNIKDKRNNIKKKESLDSNDEYIKEYNYALRVYAQMKRGNETIVEVKMSNGFKLLQILILENNNLENQEYLILLSKLPELHTLNINKNKFRSFICFYPSTSDTSKSNESSRVNTAYGMLGGKKYDGFKKLEELSFTFNCIDNLEALMGIIWLPKLKRVYLEGNPVMRKCRYKPIRKQQDEIWFDPIKILPSIYMISICDPIYLKEAEDILPTPSNTNSNFNITLLYNSKQKKKFNIAFTHKVKNDILDDPNLRRTVRREFKYTDNEIKNIVRNGHLPSLKDIKEMIKKRQNINEIDPYAVVAKSLMSIEKENQISNINNNSTKINKKDDNKNNITYIDVNNNKTFLTDVNIIENENKKFKEIELDNQIKDDNNETIINNNKLSNKNKGYNNMCDIDLFNIEEYFDSDIDSDSDDEELNLSVQESLRSLRHLLNCASVESYNDANYNKPTCNSKIRSKGWKLYRKEKTKKSKKKDDYSFDNIKKLMKTAESNLSIIEDNLDDILKSDASQRIIEKSKQLLKDTQEQYNAIYDQILKI